MELGNLIREGNTAKIYLSDKKIVKQFKSLGIAEAEKEAAKQQHAIKLGLNVPEIYDIKMINGQASIVMEYISGETLGDLLLNQKKEAAEVMNLAVDLQISMHQRKAKNFEKMPEKLYRQIMSEKILDNGLKKNLLAQISALSSGYQLCHGDFHLFNLIKKGEQIFIIDWIDATAGDIRADVFRSYLLYLEHRPELAELYLKLYCEKSRLTPHDVFVWAKVIAAARLSENVSSEQKKLLLKMVKEGNPL